MWPHGTLQWERTRIVIVTATGARPQLLRSWGAEVIIAATPLDLLGSLEEYGPAISTVVLSDVVGSATCSELARFVHEHYPFVRVFSEPAPRSADDEVDEIAVSG